jgi:DNA (cytosine-5)-methyltransferase 1
MGRNALTNNLEFLYNDNMLSLPGKTKRSIRHQNPSSFRFIDLFCGIGGFHFAAQPFGWECVFASDIDEYARKSYKANFGFEPAGDIFKVHENDIPDHEILLAGFPCQPFSIIGHRRGFEDARGTLFFEIARIIKAKRPKAFVLENVRQLVGHDGGRTLLTIMRILREDLGYQANHRVLNALDFGLPQKRERILIVGLRDEGQFEWPTGDVPMTPLQKILEKNVPQKFYASKRIVERRMAVHSCDFSPAIWHENKEGNVSSHPFSCALRAGASYNYLLVDGKRRLTPREMLRLQGFPDSFKIVCNDSQTRKQAGNAVPVPVIQAVLSQLRKVLISVPDNTARSSVLHKENALVQV